MCMKKEDQNKKKKRTLYELFFKRFFDFTLSLLAIIVLSPVFLIVWICSKFSIGGKAIGLVKMVKFSNCTNLEA